MQDRTFVIEDDLEVELIWGDLEDNSWQQFLLGQPRGKASM